MPIKEPCRKHGLTEQAIAPASSWVVHGHHVSVDGKTSIIAMLPRERDPAGIRFDVAAVGGEVPIVMSGTSSAPLVKAGKLRAIAVTGVRRLKLFP